MIPFSGAPRMNFFRMRMRWRKRVSILWHVLLFPYAEELDTLAPELSEFEIMPGNGLKGQVKEKW